MDDKIVKLLQPGTDLEVVQALREIARQIEAGEIDFPVSSCVVVIGHTERHNDPGGDDFLDQHYCEIYSSGPRCDTFTSLGLIEAAKHSLFRMLSDE